MLPFLNLSSGYSFIEPDSELEKSEGLMVQAKLPGHGPLQAAFTHRTEWIIMESQTGEVWRDTKAHPVPTTAMGRSTFH